LNTLVNFESALPSINGQFSVGVNTYVNPNDHVTLVEGFGQIKLYQNSDGSQSVLENGVYYPIKNTPYGGNPNGPQSGFIAADFYNEARVVVYQGGAFWYMNSNWAKDMTGPNSQDTGQVDSAQVSSLFLRDAPPTYALSGAYSVDEGSSAVFTLTTTNVASGTSVPYTLYGSISAADISFGALSGNAIVNSNGVATFWVNVLMDLLTEGPETLTVIAGGATASTVINDTSKAITGFRINAASASVDEGSIATFNLLTTNVDAGTSIIYSIGGVSSADITGGALSGVAIVNSIGMATISIPMIADSTTEGAETLTVTAQGNIASMTINDTSKGIATYSLSAASASVDEGSVATFNLLTDNVATGASFTLTTSNVAVGTSIPYTVSGISATDVTGGALSGVAIVNSMGTATISIPIAADFTTEGAEILTVTAQGKSASMTINDTSKTLERATAAADAIINSLLSQNIDGGDGIDTLVYTSNAAAVVISKSGLNNVVTNTATGEVDTLINVERLKFADTAIALDTTGVGGQAYRVYKAAFNRSPDLGGLGYWISGMDSGASLKGVAQGFVSSAEFKAVYGASPTNAQIITKFYENVLNRAPESSGFNYWLGILNSGQGTIADVLAAFSESPENQSSVIGIIEKGMRYTPYVPPTYSLSANNLFLNEGAVATFTLRTTNVAAGTPISYTLSGINAADVSGGALSGVAIVSNTIVGYSATISVSLLNDLLTEGAETLTVTAEGATASIVVNDTSKSIPTYSLNAASASADEGSIATFTLRTTNVAAGTSIAYSLSGISAADVFGGSLSGNSVVDSSGLATISVSLLSDLLTEGAETLTVTAGGAKASIVVNDTSIKLVGVEPIGGDPNGNDPGGIG
jgi:hypothetical protein